MDCIIVRTKLQAVIARRMAETGLVRAPVHVIALTRQVDDASAQDIARQVGAFGPLAARTTTLSRAKAGSAGVALLFAWLLAKTASGRGRVYLANVNWYPFALALKAFPRRRVYTFDDGTANVQARDNSFLAEEPSRAGGLTGWLARTLFPRGPGAFVRSRIERHATIYPGLPNLVPPERLDEVAIDWAELVDPADLARLPPACHRIFIGSVYREINRRMPRPISQDEVDALVAWADLHIPHPRESAAPRDELLVKYPAESLVAACARRGPVVMAHFNSSVALSFRDDPRVTCVELFGADPATLLVAHGR